MATGASHGQGQPSRTRGLDPVDHRLHEPFLHDPSPFPIESMVAVEPGGHDLVLRRIGQHIPGQLLDGELVKRQVSVVRSDQPFPPQPHVPAPVALKPVAVRITGQVQPLQRHPLPEMGRSEQPVQGLFVGIRRLVFGKGVHLFERGGQTGQVEARPPEQGLLVRLLFHAQPFRFQPGGQEGVDRMLGLGMDRNLRALRSDEGPMALILRSLVDPFAQNFLLFLGDRFPAVERGHVILIVIGQENPGD